MVNHAILGAKINARVKAGEKPNPKDIGKWKKKTYKLPKKAGKK